MREDASYLKKKKEEEQRFLEIPLACDGRA